MAKHISVLIIVMNLLCCITAKSQTDTFPSGKENHKDIYLYLGNIGSKSDSIIQQNNIKSIYLIGGIAIDPENNGNINKLSLQKDIERVIPDKNATGIAILDWEGKSVNKLLSLPLSSVEFGSILDQGKEIIDLAKMLRPKIKWGIYALPFRNYWSRNEDWVKRCFMLIPLLKDCDVITPSIYKLYPDSLLRSANKDYIEDNLRLALNIGRILNKPVFPFVTHRLPDSKLLPKDNFINDIDIIFKTQYLDKNVAGIIWWGPDEYYYRTNDKIVKNEVKQNETFNSYFDSLVYKYLYDIVRLNSFFD